MAEHEHDDLDQPIWSALAGSHAQYAQGNALAKRYHPAVLPFAAMRAQDPEHWSALLSMASPSHPCVLIQRQPLSVPRGVDVKVTTGLQMLAECPADEAMSPRVSELDVQREAADILELADLAKPGPLQPGTLVLGRFWGLRLEGRLVAMAGERFSLPGLTEISAICTHPDHRGRGFGRLITRHAAACVRADAATPFLHVYASNRAAIRLYERLGFQARIEVHTAIIR